MGFVFADLLGFVLFFYIFLLLFLFSAVIICEFLAGVKSRRVIWRVEELLNWKSTAGVKVWKEEKTSEICVCVCVERHRER